MWTICWWAIWVVFNSVLRFESVRPVALSRISSGLMGFAPDDGVHHGGPDVAQGPSGCLSCALVDEDDSQETTDRVQGGPPGIDPTSAIIRSLATPWV